MQRRHFFFIRSVLMPKKSEKYSEAEAQKRFEQALKGAAKAPAKKKKKAKAKS